MSRRREWINPLVWLPGLLVILLLLFLIVNAVAALVAFNAKPAPPVKDRPQHKSFWMRRS